MKGLWFEKGTIEADKTLSTIEFQQDLIHQESLLFGRNRGDKTATEGTTYWYLIEDIDIHGIRERSNLIEVRFDLNRGEQSVRVIPTHFRLWQNYPNPFNPETWLPYQLNTALAMEVR